ncbi:MAG: hypothetical protein WC863_02435 [Patescibacteria group bacterium]
MSKYFIKIIALVLLVTAFHLSSGFCFEALFNVWKIEAASAAIDESNDNKSGDNMAVCGKDQKTYPPKEISSVESAPQRNNRPVSHSSKNILPCCLDGAHSSLATFSQSGGNEKLAAVIIFIPAQIPSTIFKTFVYQPILIPPPELLALNSTVLRL